MIPSIARRLTALSLLALALTALHAAGSIIGEPSWSSDATQFGTVDPLLDAATVIRIAAMAVCAWLALVTLVDTFALASSARPLTRVASAMVPAAWRNLVLRPVALATLAAPQVLVPVAAVAPAAAEVPAPEHGDQSAPILEMETYDTPARVLTMTRHEVAVVVPPPPAPANRASDSPVWVVGPGENLWSIAAAHLGEQLDRRPSPAEVTPYWHAVIDANRHTLPDPNNPDLLYRGIELTMPPVDG